MEATQSPTGQTQTPTDYTATLLAELTLLGATLAAIASFERVFATTSWRRELFLLAVLGHLVAGIARRLPLPPWVATGLYFAGGFVVLTHTYAAETTRWQVPTRTSFSTLRQIIIDSAAEFADAIAPTAPTTAFLLLSSVALWLLIGVADAAAFRSKSIAAALAPHVAIIVFISGFGVTDRRYTLTALALAAGLLFAVVHRSTIQARDLVWLGSSADAYLTVARIAAPVAIVAGLAGFAAIPIVPGADNALIEIGSSNGGAAARVVVSPLVDIRGRIVTQQDVEVFQVRSTEPSYWRLTALDTFNGTVWSSRADYNGADGALDVVIESGTDQVTISQQFSIESLGAVWLPAAFQAANLTDVVGADISWEANSATLIVRNETPSGTSDDITYTVVSQKPSYDVAQLASSQSGYPAELAEYIELPDDFSPLARQIARDVTSNASTPYAQALALQNYFRSFTYDINVAAGHSAARIDDFLTQEIGYCEQFAGSFAAMARSLGLPARVAVGFTQGDSDPNDPTLYRVRGEHAHAWPEVYIANAGWVAFEPTPGRGRPGAEAYTNVTPEQDETGPSEATDLDGQSAAIALNDSPTPEIDRPLIGEVTSDANASTDGFAIPRSVKVGGLLATILGAIVSVVPYLQRRLRQRRLSTIPDAQARRILGAWDQATTALLPLGLHQQQAETTTEFAARSQPVLTNRKAIEQLATITNLARFSSTGPDVEQTLEAETAAAIIVAEVREKTNRVQRLKAELSWPRLRR